MSDLSKYAFCTPRYSGPLRAFCVRPVRSQRGGAVDTPSLCGTVIPQDLGGVGGHDAAEPVREDLIDDEKFVCKLCARRLREMAR